LEKARMLKLSDQRFCTCTQWEEVHSSQTMCTDNDTSKKSKSAIPPQFAIQARGYQLVFGGSTAMLA
jgi:hypothetical protein